MKKLRINNKYLISVFALFLAMACTSEDPVMVEEFGSLNDDSTADLITLKNQRGMEMSVTNYGGIITSLHAPDRNGEFENVVLGFNDFEKYLEDHPYFGAIIGRYANRIANASFELNGEEYTLAANDGENHLHGGEQGFDKVLWDYEINDDNSVTMSYRSRDGEEGYPGNLEVSVTYSLTDENELLISYEAVSDQPTPVNLTNHSYFNLSGDQTTGILDHYLTINADQYTPVNDELIPTGELEPVENTAFDFRDSTKIGDQIDEVPGGFDHNFVLNQDEDGVQQVAILYDEKSGRKMEVYTDKPGLQFYSGNFLNGSIQDSQGRPIEQHAALCLETQYFPDSPNQPQFPSTIIGPNEIYQTNTIYQFDTE